MAAPHRPRPASKADHYHAVERVLDQSQHHQRRLLSVTGKLAGLMSWLAFDTRRPALAHDYLDVGVAAADQAGDQRLSVYLAAARNRIATLTDDHASILDAALDALARAHGRPGRRLAAWVFAIQARGHAGLGHLREAEAALAASETAMANSHDDEPDLAFLDPARLRALAHARRADRSALVATHAQRVGKVEHALAGAAT